MCCMVSRLLSGDRTGGRCKDCCMVSRLLSGDRTGGQCIDCCLVDGVKSVVWWTGLVDGDMIGGR